jgi:DNA-binding CsgD family transcriptional regulator
MDGLLERDEELVLLDRLLTEASSGRGRLLVLEGDAGVGKSSLLDLAARLGDERGFAVLRGRGHPLEDRMSFGVVRQLLEAAGQDGELRPALDSGGPPVAALLDPHSGPDRASELDLVHAAYLVLRALCDRRPLLLVVDDLQWVDSSSVRVLVYLTQRIGSHGIALVAAHRPGEEPRPEVPLDWLIDENAHAFVKVQPLSAGGSRDLVVAHWPRATSRVVDECHRLTHGNPLLLHEILRSLDESAVTRCPAEELGASAPRSVRRSTRLRLDRAGPEVRSVAEAVAVLEPDASLRAVAAIAALPLSSAVAGVDVLVAASLLRDAAAPRFVHPLIRSAVRDGIRAADLAERHRRAAGVLAAEGAEPQRVAAHLLLATPVGDVSAVTLLRRAASDALTHGSAESAARYLERALAEPPPHDVRWRVLAELAETRLLDGRTDGLDALDTALGDAPGSPERIDVLATVAPVLFQSGFYDRAAEAFAEALGLLPDGDPRRPRLASGKLAIEGLLPGGETRVDSEPGPTTDDPGARAVLVHRALGSVFACTPHHLARDLARAALAEGRMVADEGVGLDVLVTLGCLVWCDDYATAEREVRLAMDWTDQHTAHLARAHLHFGRGWSRYFTGDLEASLHDSRAAIATWEGGWGAQVSLARYWSASALVELDRVDEAERVLRQSPAEHSRADAVGRVALHVARGSVASARGQHDRAWTELAEAVPRARDLPYLHNPTVMPWRARAALAARAAGSGVAGSRVAGDLAEEELELARRFGAPRALAVALRTQAAVLGGAPGLAALEEATAVLVGSDARLEAAHVQLALGAALRRAGRRSQARDPLSRALESATALGAKRLVAQATAELRAAGARPRRAALTGVAALTPSELRVAQRAAAGAGNVQIAAELVLSRRTVEFHLSGTYRKLGVTSRDELARLLGTDPGLADGDPAATPDIT